ncbi:MAG: hypothetical protein IIZ93_14180 [Acidaminococcaceae bacterium]|nr:hypothetical protein [Acidaminococcaceae bacterium]
MRYLIAIPSHDMIPARFLESFEKIKRLPNTALANIRSTLIYTARNIIAENAVKEGFDRVLWLDSDMLLPEDLMIRLAADMDEGRELVTGLYFSRVEPMVPCIQSRLEWELNPDGWVKTGADIYYDYPKDQVFEIAGCGFGAVMTSTALLKRMCEKYGHPFFPLMGMGEDTSFCWRAIKEGEKLYCDSRLSCGHIGQDVFDEERYWKGRKSNEMPV